MAAIHNLIRWEAYRVRKEQILTMYFEARQQLARKKVLALMVAFHMVMKRVWGKYTTFYNLKKLADSRDLAHSRIVGIFKYVMRKKFAQLHTMKQMEEN